MISTMLAIGGWSILGGTWLWCVHYTVREKLKQ